MAAPLNPSSLRPTKDSVKTKSFVDHTEQNTKHRVENDLPRTNYTP